ncbi:MAG TPA: ABC transporter substrate-binding protein [Xanthobacteraceae bacterium]|jgi:putative tryptophan/tyrosine transport system substrate-binding protein
MAYVKRRDFIILLGVASAACPFAWSLPLSAQQPKRTFRIGILSGRRPETILREALARLGYIEGQNTIYEVRNAQAQMDRIGRYAAELVDLKVDVIVALGGPAAEAAKRATSTIPIVLWAVGDPVGLGLVTNVARPGGNITGVTELSTELTPKRLQLLKELVPDAARIAIVWNSSDRAMDLRAKEFATTATRLGVTMVPVPIRESGDIDGALAGLAGNRPDAIMIVTDPVMGSREAATLEFLAKHGLPAMYEFGDSARRGALLSYGPSLTDLAPRAAEYVDRILRGAKPGDLPLEGPTRYYLTVNLKTAKALGIEVPTSILLRADEVIE